MITRGDKGVFILTAAALSLGVFVGALAQGVGSRAEVRTHLGPAISEDSPGWDCVAQGNRTCRVAGHLVTSVDGLPRDPYGACLYLLGIHERLGRIKFSADVCARIADNRG